MKQLSTEKSPIKLILIENLAEDEREADPSEHKARDGGDLETARSFSSPLRRCWVVDQVYYDPRQHGGEEENFVDCNTESNPLSYWSARPEMQ